MEEYYKYSDQLLANLFQIIGKFTSKTNQKLTNISKFTSNLQWGEARRDMGVQTPAPSSPLAACPPGGPLLDPANETNETNETIETILGLPGILGILPD